MNSFTKKNACENITKKNINTSHVEYIRKKLKNNIDNPPLVIQKITIDSPEKIFHVIQDGFLLVGTKQRVATLFIQKILKERKDIHTLLYAGTANGFGALAVAYAAYKLGLFCEVFLSDVTDYQSRQLTTLHALNAKIISCPTFRDARNMEYSYSIPKNDSYQNIEGYYTVPMGLNTDVMINLLAKQIKKASKNTILEKIENPRIWLVAGSGGIAMSLRIAFPTAKLFLFLTGGGSHLKKVIKWSKKTKNVFIIKDEKYKNIREDIPYSSVKNYDDKIFPYVEKYGKSGDFIWNIASDDYIF
jgi:hypothetical protein